MGKGVVPKKKPAKVAWFRSKVAPWTTNSVAIGSSAPTVSAFATLVTSAEDALAEQDAAWGAYKAKVDAADIAIDAMARAGADIISQVRIKANTAGDIIYTLAEIPAPATPTPVPAPGKPYDFGVELFPDGSIKLTWACDNPVGGPGPLYLVWRKNPETGKFESLGGSGGREFTDTTVPSGVPSVVYKVQATRTTAIGVAAEFTVNFGTTPAGGTVATVMSAPKIAA